LDTGQALEEAQNGTISAPRLARNNQCKFEQLQQACILLGFEPDFECSQRRFDNDRHHTLQRRACNTHMIWETLAAAGLFRLS